MSNTTQAEIERLHSITAIEHARELNARIKQRSGDGNMYFLHPEDEQFYTSRGILTGYDFQLSISIETYHDMYKELYNLRDRHTDTSKWTLHNAENAINNLYDAAADEEWKEINITNSVV